MRLRPKIKKFKARKIVGLLTKFIPPGFTNANNMEVIPNLWAKLESRTEELKHLGPKYPMGISVPTGKRGKSATTGEMYYLACVEVRKVGKVPRGMKCGVVPAGNYAVFSHRGDIATIGDTYSFIFEEWAVRSRRELRDAASIELYEKFKPGKKSSVVEILIPVE